jgi:hypothetical protein
MGDEVLESYLDFFSQPLRTNDIHIVLSMFGWLPDELTLFEDAPLIEGNPVEDEEGVLTQLRIAEIDHELLHS